MVKHICDRCKIEFNKKSTYINHLNRKNQCKVNIIVSDEIQIKSDENPMKPDENYINYDNIIETKQNINHLSIYCKFCNKEFKRKDYLKKHLDQSCKLKKEKETMEATMLIKIAELEEKNKKIEEKNKKMEEEINNLKLKKTKKAQPNIIINQTNNTINNNNQINIANFGTLDNKKIGDKIFYHTLTNFSGLKTLLKFIEYVHKNNKLKEYQNVEITDL